MTDGGIGLRLAGHGDRRAHLHAHRLRQIFKPALGHLHQALKKRHPFRFARLAIGRKGRHRRRNRRVHICRIPQGHDADLALIGGV